VEGHAYRLRPAGESDTDFILALRTDSRLNQFINPTPPDRGAHLRWLAEYNERPHDYYFVVERRAGNRPEGTIGLYNLNPSAQTAEWGRWLILPDSLAAVESAWLIYQTAFDSLHLDSTYCRTLADNEKVVAFHDSTGCERGSRAPGDKFVEHTMSRAAWQTLGPALERKVQRLAAVIAR
jgi:RimJ/RimL family protein N-acetyltransferase